MSVLDWMTVVSFVLDITGLFIVLLLVLPRLDRLHPRKDELKLAELDDEESQ